MNLRDAPSYARLPDRALIRLAGPDWRSFLQGLITQDVLAMADGETRYAALLTPQGRLLHDLFVTARGDGALLDVAAETRDLLLGRLKLYRLRAKVEIMPPEGEVVVLFGGGGSPEAASWRRDPRLAALGWRGFDAPAPSGARLADADAYDRHRLALGVGDILRDDLGDAYALEANLDLLNGVDFHKGCFVGQETTSRMKRRGGVRSRLVPLRYEGTAVAPRTEVLAGALRAGEARSGAQGASLALVRLDRAAGAALTVDGRPARLDPAEWLRPALTAGEPVSAA